MPLLSLVVDHPLDSVLSLVVGEGWSFGYEVGWMMMELGLDDAVSWGERIGTLLYAILARSDASIVKSSVGWLH